MNKTTLVFVVVLLCSFVSCQNVYSREYQMVLDINDFEGSIGDGFDLYMTTWSEASGMDYRNLNRTDSIRVEYNTNNLDDCGGTGIIRQRDYIAGDREGLVTIDVKTTGSLNQSEAEDEPFYPSAAYVSMAVQQIEEDYHPCTNDFAADTRIFTDSLIDFNTCADVEAVFPGVSDGSNTSLDTSGGNTYTLTIFCEGNYLDGFVTTDITINYNSLSDAMSNQNPRGGEFSFTIISTDGDNFSSQQTQKGNQIYDYMLTEIGSFGEQYPCDSSNTSQSSNTSNESSILQMSIGFIFALLFVMM